MLSRGSSWPGHQGTPVAESVSIFVLSLDTKSKVAAYHLSADNISWLKRLVNLDLVLLCCSNILHTDDALPFSLQHRLSDLLDDHNGLLRHQTHHASQHDVVDVGQHLALATVASDGNSRKLVGSRGRDFVEALCRARRLGRCRDADNAHERRYDVAIVNVRARACSVFGGWAEDFARQCECGRVSSHGENCAL